MVARTTVQLVWYSLVGHTRGGAVDSSHAWVLPRGGEGCKSISDAQRGPVVQQKRDLTQMLEAMRGSIPEAVECELHNQLPIGGQQRNKSWDFDAGARGHAGALPGATGFYIICSRAVQ